MVKMGDLILARLEEEVVLETRGWARETVDRVADRLQARRPLESRLLVHVPWISGMTAFTAPGRHIFLSRSLLERCRTEEMVAMVIAHEIAHHDLGHLDRLPSWLAETLGDEGSIWLAGLYRLVERRLFGVDQECDADRRGLDLCVEAGYDGAACLELFDVLERLALDRRALWMVFGPSESDDELAPDAPFSTRARIWLFHRRHGYLPIRDRRQMLLDHLARPTDGPEPSMVDAVPVPSGA